MSIDINKQNKVNISLWKSLFNTEINHNNQPDLHSPYDRLFRYYNSLSFNAYAKVEGEDSPEVIQLNKTHWQNLINYIDLRSRKSMQGRYKL